MDDAFRNGIQRYRDWLCWLPGWAAAAIIVPLVCSVGLGLHALALQLIRRSRLGQWRFPQLRIMRAANPTRRPDQFVVFAAATSTGSVR